MSEIESLQKVVCSYRLGRVDNEATSVFYGDFLLKKNNLGKSN